MSESSRIESATFFTDIELMIIDSLVEMSPVDTTTKVRYVRAVKKIQQDFDAATSQTHIDTTTKTQTQTRQIPDAGQKKKNGLASLCASVRMALCIIFLVFFTILLQYVKKNIFLRRN